MTGNGSIQGESTKRDSRMSKFIYSFIKRKISYILQITAMSVSKGRTVIVGLDMYRSDL